MTEDTYVTRQQFEAAGRRIVAKLDAIERRLFRDNGAVSIQTRLDRHEQTLRVLLWGLGLFGGGFLAALGSGLVIVLREMLARGAL